ncbi:sphingosine-1-phosphate phosphatase 2-like [Planococcus citri]|uniref:sphingosine-1-phosphate phosphatase 2-like n=1 Tax=Planococcus citri TaxID=170843 RepID=UPI0031F93C20
MIRVIAILKDPSIVAKIQNCFGVSYLKDTLNIKTANENEHRSQEQPIMLRKKSNKNLTELDDDKETVELTYKPNNGSLTLEEPVSRTESSNKNSPETKETRSYEVKYKSWYFIFLFGTYLGDHIGYAIFLPFWFWNIDAQIARKIVLVWTLVMYIGQVSKDIIQWPRPACPPVIRLQKKWSLEYGMPSTHAMVGVALPSSVLYYTSHRYKFPVEIGVSLALLFCILISLSRLYLGMHSLLDILAGLLFSSLLVLPFLPLVDYTDKLIEHDWFLFIIIAISVILIATYPSGKTWTPTRGDTTTILSTCVGIQTAAWLHYKVNWVERPPFDPPFAFDLPPLNEIGYVAIRTLLGYLGIVVVLLFFDVLNKIFDWVLTRMRVKVKDVNTNRRLAHIDLIYKYLTYSTTSFNIVFVFPYIFQCLNINRTNYYWE